MQVTSVRTAVTAEHKMKIKLLIAAGIVLLAVSAAIIYYIMCVQVVPDKNGMLYEEAAPSSGEDLSDNSQEDANVSNN